MDGDIGATAPQAIWINWTDHILSFHQEAGFERLDFLSSQEKMNYVFEQCSNGFRIQ